MATKETPRRVELVLSEIITQIQNAFGTNYQPKHYKEFSVRHQRCGRSTYFFFEIKLKSGLRKEFFVPMVVSVVGYKQLRSPRVRYLLSQEIAIDLKNTIDESIKSKSYRTWA